MFILLGILALGAFLRFYQIKEIPLGLYPDEAMNGNNALEAIQNTHFSARGGSAFGGKVFYPENNGREGLFINLQAISVAAFGNTPWALRIVSALLGTLTILGIYLVAKELFQNHESRITNQGDDDARSRDSYFVLLDSRAIALLSAFFLATSYWHLNFSRIGFRAIMLPLVACFAMYYLLKGLRTGRIPHLVVAAVLAGLGFYTYIAYRFMVFVALVPMAWHLWQTRKKPTASPKPYLIPLFLFVAFVVALPIGIYFLRNPQQFFNRADEISVFAAASPIKELGASTLKTLGMFFWRGDCNWRHNYNCSPELHPLVAVFFLAGLVISISSLLHRKRSSNDQAPMLNQTPSTNDQDEKRRLRFGAWDFIGNWKLGLGILFSWLFFMMLPVVLTREGLPHALRAIGMIPPVMILAAFGAQSLASLALSWFEKQKSRWPAKTRQIARIQREMGLLSLLILLVIPLATYRTYFLLWAQNKKTYEAFDTSSWHLGQFLAGTGPEVKKYVMVNTLGVPVRGIPTSAQTVMFATNTFPEAERERKNVTYLAGPDMPDNIVIPEGQETLIAFLDGTDRALIGAIQKKHPELEAKTPGDFIVLQNY